MTTAPPSPVRARTISAGILALAITSLAIAAFQTIDPAGFVDRIGPFGSASDHYLRDLATWSAAYGIALLIAVSRPSWRAAVLGLGIAQNALHLVNHIVDVGEADPVSTGVIDAVLLAGTLAVSVWLYRAVRAQEPGA